MNIDSYLRLCEQLGEEPDPEKMPLSLNVFPQEVQTAFFVFDLLTDRWSEMSGLYTGKDYNNILDIFHLYDIDEPQIVFFFLKLYDNILVHTRAEEADKKRKREEAKQKAKQMQSGGKQYTHNVKG